MSSRHWLLMLPLLFGVSLPVGAAGPEDYQLLIKSNRSSEEFEDKRWVEIEPDFPAAPEAGRLIPIDVGSLSENRFEVDEASVTVGADGVIRFTVVVTSPGGVRNVSYEGMRCDTAERRLYALGRRDGSWSKARNSQWVRIAENSLNRHHAALYRDYFCASGGAVSTTAEARRILPKGNPAVMIR